ncbi:MAG: nicotinate (nicotinamide) nucleotide adenylyltransferase [Planctomycetota bacterium]|nr:nicotinate (nicotinamide) nucleotide adenylyltransferase [Planctomycetota bacterium]
MGNELPFGPLKRFGVLGGSFDPIHVGHLSIAQQILDALHLEKVVLLPAATPPHKRDGRELASAADRLAMCKLAIHNLHGLAVSGFELRKRGVSYTVETARALRKAYGPATRIFFIIGSDSLAELPHWYEIRELISLLDFAVAERREAPLKESLWQELRAALGPAAEEKLRLGVVAVERVDVSSTLIREMLKAGEKIPGYLRRDVEEHIRARGLYGAPPRPTKRGRIALR